MIYDKLAKNYDKAFAPFEKRFVAAWRRETLSRLPACARILEIGAGTGLNFKFYPPCRLAVASEISVKMLELAREKTVAIKLVQTDAESLPFAANSFDAAFATLVFCSIPKPENAFDELKRVVKQGGKIVLLEHVRPNGALGCAFDFLNIFTVALIEDHFNRRTRDIAENAGLKILEVKRKAFGIVNLIVCEVKTNMTSESF
ncbi:MAG TPA: methyltransferase domain-containing protein [Pyrinomonadaceae bacterium]|jgi:ubiquinone/menaquinone biosynthesis C-methylase UbiE